MKKILSALLCICIISGLFPNLTYAKPEWPSNVAIEAEGGIVIDAETGAVLYGKNIHISYFPASITKILTALVVIENCDLDEVVTFSRNAVYNVEQGSTNMAADTGDQLTVRECLYGLLLKSANEAGNALAEHISGSIEAFSVLMNDKAKELGCTESNFVNPSGLNNPNHYTTAYDMAIISRAAFKNETFVEIDSTLSYDISPTQRNPDGLRIYAGHKMMKKNESQYYPGVIGGKTGYTTLAGNTLVTYAEKDNLTLITVILDGHQTHYSDTKALLDFGFKNFVSVPASTFEINRLPLDNEMIINGIEQGDLSALQIDDTSYITMPKSADLSDITSDLNYQLADDAPPGAIALVQYSYDQRKIGSSYIFLNQTDTESYSETDTSSEANTSSPDNITETTTTAETTKTKSKAPVKDKQPFKFSTFAIILIIVVLFAASIVIAILYKKYRDHKEEAARLIRHQRRMERLESSDISTTEFEELLHKKRSTSSRPQPEGLLDLIKRVFHH